MRQSTSSSQSDSYVGKDLACHTCGCEIMVKHWGDPASHARVGVFLCHCGTTMEPEHERGQSGGADGGGGADDVSQDDFLHQRSGAGGATGMGSTSSSSVSPGGGT